MISDEEKIAMITDIYNKASNNHDGEIWIRPSNYGFARSCEGSNECAKVLMQLKVCRKIVIDGKDLLRIQVQLQG